MMWHPAHIPPQWICSVIASPLSPYPSTPPSPTPSMVTQQPHLRLQTLIIHHPLNLHPQPPPSYLTTAYRLCMLAHLSTPLHPQYQLVLHVTFQVSDWVCETLGATLVAVALTFTHHATSHHTAQAHQTHGIVSVTAIVFHIHSTHNNTWIQKHLDIHIQIHCTLNLLDFQPIQSCTWCSHQLSPFTYSRLCNIPAVFHQQN
jgi:hypothetical protein